MLKNFCSWFLDLHVSGEVGPAVKGCEMLGSDAVNNLTWEDWQSLEKNIFFLEKKKDTLKYTFLKCILA